MKRSRRKWVGLALAVILALGYVVALPWIGPRFQLMTEAEVEAALPAELRWTPPPAVPDEQNGYVMLKAYLGAQEPGPTYQEVADFAASDPRLEEFLAERRRERDIVESALAAPHFQLPNPLADGYIAELYDLKHFCSSQWQAALRAADLNRLDDAVEAVCVSLRVADAFERNANTVIALMTAWAVRSGSCTRAGMISESHPVSERHLLRLLELLPERPEADPSIASALLAELHLVYLPLLSEQTADPQSLRWLGFTDGKEVIESRWPRAAKLKARPTLKMLVEQFATSVENSQLPYSQLKPLPLFGKALPKEPASGSGFRSWFDQVRFEWEVANHPNFLGETLVSDDALHRLPFFSQWPTGFSATRLALGIRLYRLRTAKLPERLDDLVEAGIFERLPLDPFSGKPFVWSKERRLFYSVGKDAKDDGGSFTNSPRSPDLFREPWRFAPQPPR